MLKKVLQKPNKYYKIIQFYCNKLVELGAMRNLKNTYFSEGNYTKPLKNIKEKVSNE